jgi:hypothetical protein
MAAVRLPGAEVGIDGRFGVPTKDVLAAIKRIVQDPRAKSYRNYDFDFAVSEAQTGAKIGMFDLLYHSLMISI